jgi:hypothetical protein
VKRELGLVDLKVRLTGALLFDKEVSEVRSLKITLVNSVVFGGNAEGVCRDVVKSCDDEVTFRVENIPIVKVELSTLKFVIKLEEVSIMFEFVFGSGKKELVMLYEFASSGPDEIAVNIGERVEESEVKNININLYILIFKYYHQNFYLRILFFF